jgi:hypothetical protein
LLTNAKRIPRELGGTQDAVAFDDNPQVWEADAHVYHVPPFYGFGRVRCALKAAVQVAMLDRVLCEAVGDAEGYAASPLRGRVGFASFVRLSRSRSLFSLTPEETLMMTSSKETPMMASPEAMCMQQNEDNN